MPFDIDLNLDAELDAFLGEGEGEGCEEYTHDEDVNVDAASVPVPEPEDAFQGDMSAYIDEVVVGGGARVSETLAATPASGTDPHTYVPGTLVERVEDTDALLAAVCSAENGRPIMVLLGQTDTALGAVTDFLFGKYSRMYTQLDFLRVEFSTVRDCAADWGIRSTPSYAILRDETLLGTLCGAHPRAFELALEELNADSSADVSALLADAVDLDMCVGEQRRNRSQYLHQRRDQGPSSCGRRNERVHGAAAGNGNGNRSVTAAVPMYVDDLADLGAGIGEEEGERSSALLSASGSASAGVSAEVGGAAEAHRIDNDREMAKEHAVQEIWRQVEEIVPAISNLAGWWSAQRILEWLFP